MVAPNTQNPGIKVPLNKIEAMLNDPKQCAKAISLVYVSDAKEGICRIKKGKQFSYSLGNKKITDKEILDRIKKLVIPPAWKKVWICQLENGHLQATGFDALNRKQYRYHNLWSSFRNQTKFYRLCEFGKSLPAIRKQINRDLAEPGLSINKVLATVISLMEQTSIRVGNKNYEKLYGSFGLTTLKNKHVNIHVDKIQFSFKVKKGVVHNITLNNKKLARIAKQCRDIPGKELFQYYDQEGKHHPIDSGMVNDYLRAITGKDFTTKDFRTWIGSKTALEALKNIDLTGTKVQTKNNIIAVVDEVAAHLGNTRSVCKKYYIHPILLELAERNELAPYFFKTKKIKASIQKLSLSTDEKLLLSILEQELQIPRSSKKS